jgi:hypothetical protein
MTTPTKQPNADGVQADRELDDALDREALRDDSDEVLLADQIHAEMRDEQRKIDAHFQRERAAQDS